MENQVNTDPSIKAQKQEEGKLHYAVIPDIILLVHGGKHPGNTTIIRTIVGLTKSQHMFEVSSDIVLNYIKELLPYTTLEDVARAAMYGNTKYARCNWKLGSNWSFWLEACVRHLMKTIEGQELDEESGCPHLAHAVMNLGILHYHVTGNVGINDLSLDTSTNVE